MKFGQIVLLIITSIITFIGLVINKIYQNYIKDNQFLQIIIWSFWTLVVIKFLAWMTRTFIDIPVTIKTVKTIGYMFKDVCTFISSIPMSNGLLTCIFIVVLIISSYGIGKLIKGVTND